MYRTLRVNVRYIAFSFEISTNELAAEGGVETRERSDRKAQR